MKRVLGTILLVLIADQALKVWVKLNMLYDTAFSLFGDWGYIHFIENRGMAFGLEFGGSWGKLALTLFRIAAVIGIGAYLRHLIREKASTAMLISSALVFAGALGNIIDSTFYGLIFSRSTDMQLAVLFPPDGGYASLFHGAVVDMFYFPLFEGRFPEWLPFWGGEHYLFFRPVFNLADAAITVGIGAYILAQRSIPHPEKPVTQEGTGAAHDPVEPLPAEGTPPAEPLP